MIIENKSKKKIDAIKASRRFNWLGRRRTSDALDPNIMPLEAFRSILRRERARSDRTGQTFSLIVFDTENARNGSFPVTGLLPILSTRLRESDDVGWFDKRRIGVILPDTPVEGAQKVAEDLDKTLRAGATTPPSHMVYSYPSDWLADEMTSQQLEFNDVKPDWSRRRSQDIHVKIEKPARKPEPANHEAVSSALDAPQKLEPLLAQKIPFVKRLFDCTISFLAIVALAPLMSLIALYIKIVSPGPIFFSQIRVGYRGDTFRCWKFRTMKPDVETSTHQNHFKKLMEEQEPMKKLDAKSDPRIIPLGGLLRSSGLDELPQLFNVLKGEMSLIGPRPCIPYEFENYARWQRTRCDTVPGLSGLWQVSGKNKTTFNEMMRLDINYARRMSLGLDLRILLDTLPAIVNQVNDDRPTRRKRESTKELA